MMTPLKAARGTAALIPGVREVVIRGAGHIMLDEAPDETLDALRNFLPKSGLQGAKT